MQHDFLPTSDLFLSLFVERKYRSNRDGCTVTTTENGNISLQYESVMIVILLNLQHQLMLMLEQQQCWRKLKLQKWHQWKKEYQTHDADSKSLLIRECQNLETHLQEIHCHEKKNKKKKKVEEEECTGNTSQSDTK